MKFFSFFFFSSFFSLFYVSTLCCGVYSLTAIEANRAERRNCSCSSSRDKQTWSRGEGEEEGEQGEGEKSIATHKIRQQADKAERGA